IFVDDITELASGTYSFDVQFVGDNIQYLNSSVSTLLDITRVEKVQNVRLSQINKNIEWDSVDGVTKYKLVYTNASAEENIIQYVNDAFTTIPSELSAGQIIVKVYAVGNNDNKVNSIASDVLTVTKIDAPQNYAVENGVFTFDKVDSYENYVISINKDGTVTTTDFVYSDEGFALDLTEVGNYEISVCVSGDYITTINSNFSESVEITKLNSVSDIFVQNNQILWDGVDSALGYKLIFSGASEYETTVQNCYYDINREELLAGIYTVTIIALGDNTTILSSEGEQSVNLFRILSMPTNIAFNSEKQLIWDSVANAIGYNVDIIDNTNNATKLNVTDNSCAIPENLSSGNYSIIIVAYGDNGSLVDSKNSNAFNITKLETPTAIAHQNCVITVTANSGIENYVIIITNENNDEVSLDVDKSTMTANYSFADAGLYTISCYSKGDYLTTIDSGKSQSIQVRRLEAPVASITNNEIIWNENPYVKANKFKYNVVIKNNDVVVYNDSISGNSVPFDKEELTAGAYVVEVQALAGENVEFLPSAVTSLSSITKFKAPVISDNLTNNKITWTVDLSESELLSVTGFEVKIVDSKGEERIVTISNVSELTYELGESFNAGVYKISVRVLGDGQSFIRSAFSEEKEICKLENSQVYIHRQDENSSTSPYVASWDAITGATSYVVVFNNSQVITTTDNYIVLDNLSSLNIGSNTIKIQVNGDDSYYVNSNISVESSFNVMDSESANLRIESGVLVWDAVANTKIYLLKINEIVVNCGQNTTYALADSFGKGTYQISIKLITVDNDGYKDVLVNSTYSQNVEGYKLETPDAPKIINGEVKMSVVEYKNLEEGFENRLTYQIQYGNYDQTIVLDKNKDLIRTIYSNMIGVNSEIKYRAIGNDYNLTSSWSSTVGVVYGKELPNTSNIYMRDGVLSWTTVPNASKYKLIARVIDENGGLSDTQYELYTDSPSASQPFYFEQFQQNGVSLRISIISIGTLDSMSDAMVFTNSKDDVSYVITYLPKVTSIISQEGVLKWTGTSDNGYDIEIDGVVKTIMENSYSFENESAGKHTVKIRLKGNGEEVSDGMWSDYAVIYKIDTPTYYVETFLTDGKLGWNTNAGFLSQYVNPDIDTLGILNYVQILFSSSTVEDFTLTKQNIETMLNGSNYQSVLNDYFDEIDTGTYSLRIKNLGTT
ncbi:MAG: hypothetical protein ACI4TX_00880, partial [Christensenellales bacterium]